MQNNKLNCATARNISIVKALEKLGHFPKKISEQEAWFLSPFRSETQASLKVSIPKNRWYDHGQGKGGNVIDLLSMLLQCSVKEVLQLLQEDFSGFSFQQPVLLPAKPTSKILVNHIKNLYHPGLIQYLYRRKINPKIAALLCKEVYYQVRGKKYFALGLQNRSGGWELRNAYFKSSTSPKDISFISNQKSSLVITEGMFDALSLLTCKEVQMDQNDLLVLNSISFVDRALEIIKNYEHVFLYLDNDAAGRKATNHFLESHKNSMDKSGLYKNFKDINEMLCHGTL